MTHNGIWAAVDKIAARQGLSCSGLARACGMVLCRVYIHPAPAGFLMMCFANIAFYMNFMLTHDVNFLYCCNIILSRVCNE